MSDASLRPVHGTEDQVRALLFEWQAAADPQPLMIETSGSSGRPKRVVLSRAAMRASAHASHARLGGPGRWTLTLPAHYVAGVQVLFRTIVAGPEATRRYISLVPTQLVRALEDSDSVANLVSYDAVLVGGGPLDREVRAKAVRRGISIVQTYGMSETCGGCVYDGYPLDGVDLSIESGQVLIRGPMLFDEYDDEAERTEAAMAGGWFHTDDLGSLDGGCLTVEGRADDVIISGGVKVPALVVASALRRFGPVGSVEVVGVPDPEWGERVVAVIAGGRPSLDEIRDDVNPRTWAPRQLLLVDEIPTLPNGKPDRQTMKTWAVEKWSHG